MIDTKKEQERGKSHLASYEEIVACEQVLRDEIAKIIAEIEVGV